MSSKLIIHAKKLQVEIYRKIEKKYLHIKLGKTENKNVINQMVKEFAKLYIKRKQGKSLLLDRHLKDNGLLFQFLRYIFSINKFHKESTDLKRIEEGFDKYFLKKKIDCIKMTHNGKKYDNFFCSFNYTEELTF